MSDILRPTRRGVIGGIGLLFAAPAIVKASSLMPVKVYRPDYRLVAVFQDGVLLELGIDYRVDFDGTIRLKSAPPPSSSIGITNLSPHGVTFDLRAPGEIVI